MNDLYDELYDDDEYSVTFEKFRQKPKQGGKESKMTKKDVIREKQREKALEKEELINQEIHGVF